MLRIATIWTSCWKEKSYPEFGGWLVDWLLWAETSARDCPDRAFPYGDAEGTFGEQLG